MGHVAYRSAISSIATAEAEGEDVEGRISYLAKQAGMDRAMIRQEVTEFAAD